MTMSEPTDRGSEHPQEPPYGQPGAGSHSTGRPSYGAQPPYQDQPPHAAQPPHGNQPPYGQHPYTPPPPYPTAHPPLSPSDERTWAILAHIVPPVVTLLTAGTLGILAPLVVWLMFRDRSRYVDEQAKESLNFQLTLLIAYVIGFVTLFVLIGVLILVVAFVLALVFGIQAALAASRHEPYRYPISIRFIS